jgi:fibronectin type 3 domain-containing protein
MVLAQRVQLAWDSPAAPNLSYYGVYRATDANGAFTLIAKINYPGTTYNDDAAKSNPRYYYVTTAVDRSGNESGFSNMVEAKIQSPTEVEVRALSPAEFYLAQNHPNPFNPVTTISYNLPQKSQVNLTVYDVNGREVYRLVDELQEAGRHEVRWPGVTAAGIEAPSGIYYYRIRTASHAMFRKMTLLK